MSELIAEMRPRCAPATTAAAPRRPTASGRSATSASTASGTRRDGRGRDQRLPHSPRGDGARRRLDAEPGAVRAALPLSPRARARGRATWATVVRADDPAAAGRSHARGGAGGCSAALEGEPWLVALAALRRRPAPHGVPAPARLDLDLARGEILVRGGKGDKDRVTMLPRSLRPPLEAQLARSRALHERDLADGWGRVAAARRAGAQVSARRRASGAGSGSSRSAPLAQPRTGEEGRHHVHETILQRAVRDAVRRRASPSTPPATRCATRLPPTCSRRATTSARSRSCSATRTCARP